MPLDDIVIRKRLGFIKYLYQIGAEQSKAPDPACSIALLSFHDAMDMFLRLAVEHLDVKGDPQFIQYWDKINEKLTELSILSLGYREAAIRLNKARVELKHRGTRPSPADIEEFRSTTNNFFRDSTPLLFQLNFSTISLVDLITDEHIRESIRSSIDQFIQQKYDESLISATTSFAELIDSYQQRHQGRWGRPLFSIVKESADINLRDLPFGGGSSEEFQCISDFVSQVNNYKETVNESLHDLESLIQIIGFGIDYRRYTTFRAVTPRIFYTLGGNTDVIDDIFPEGTSDLQKQTIIQFCLDFIIDCALTLQQFNIHNYIPFQPSNSERLF